MNFSFHTHAFDAWTLASKFVPFVKDVFESVAMELVLVQVVGWLSTATSADVKRSSMCVLRDQSILKPIVIGYGASICSSRITSPAGNLARK